MLHRQQNWFQPGTLVINMRKNELRFLKNRLLLEKDDIIFNSYLEYIIRRNYSENIDKEVVNSYEMDREGLARAFFVVLERMA